jgi:hypothetical protein
MWMAQKHIRGEGLDKDLCATALALADGDIRVAIVDLDLCFLPDRQSAAIRELAGKASGIPPENVLPFCSHTHAGPVNLGVYRGEGEDRVRQYIEFLPHMVAGAVKRAVDSLVPVRVAAGAGRSDIGINRDLRIADGRTIVGCNPDGPADREVMVGRLDTIGGQPLACILNYQCHPTVLGPGNRTISPDYPGHARAMVEQVTGATCLFIQGAAGDMGPVDTFVDDVRAARRLGAMLGLEGARVFLGLDTRPVRRRLRGVIPSGAPLADYEDVPLETAEPSLRFLTTPVSLPLRPLAEVYQKAPGQLAEARARLESMQRQGADATALATQLQQIVRLSLRADRVVRYGGKASLPLESFALRIGEAALAAVAGEPYCEIGMAVKGRSPFPGRTLFGGYVGGDMMYIPMASTFGIHPPPMQVDNSPYAAGAAGLVVEHLSKLLTAVR